MAGIFKIRPAVCYSWRPLIQFPKCHNTSDLGSRCCPIVAFSMHLCLVNLIDHEASYLKWFLGIPNYHCHHQPHHHYSYHLLRRLIPRLPIRPIDPTPYLIPIPEYWFYLTWKYQWKSQRAWNGSASRGHACFVPLLSRVDIGACLWAKGT